jgi:BirA family biotin operon repressor/biotin-[acetyl-CoA-carboxylase] ligase
LPYASPGKPQRLLFIELQTVDSTNNYALSRAHAGLAQHGLAIFAHEQLAGKGQRGKEWSTGKDMNIALSLVLRPTGISIHNQFHLSACVAVSCHAFLSKYTKGDVTIKWPNDVYWQDRKAGGILIESIIKGNEWAWSIAGIGLNINQTTFNENLPNPVSLKQITGRNFEISELVKELSNTVFYNYETLVADGPGEILKIYRAHLHMKNERVKFKAGNRIFEAIVKDVTDTGKLLLHHSIDEEFSFGEIEWISIPR